jgi:hypothetical protein
MPPVAPTTRIGADDDGTGEESAAEVGQRAQSWRRTSDAAAIAATPATPAAAQPGLLGSPKRSGRRRQWWQRLMARSRGYSTVEVWGCRRKTNNRVVRCRRPRFSLSRGKQERCKEWHSSSCSFRIFASFLTSLRHRCLLCIPFQIEVRLLLAQHLQTLPSSPITKSTQ